MPPVEGAEGRRRTNEKEETMIRRLGAILVALALVLSIGLVPGVVLAGNNGVEPYDPEGMTLYAGQHIPVGTVTVTNDADEICVTYELDADVAAEGWGFTELHLHIAGDADDIPVNRPGNPIPGHFDHKAYFDLDDEKTGYTFCIALADLEVEAGDPVYIAAHAVVEKPEVLETLDDCIVSDTDTLYYDDDTEEWKSSVPTWVHPAWAANTAIAALMDDGASWIWESEYALNPREGDVLQFKREFEIPGTPTSGTLSITVDNEYQVELNDEYVGAGNDWSTVTDYDVTDELLPGDNTLTINAENWPWDTDDSEVNPGGVIYRLCYDYEVVIEEHQKETAWADGTRFVDRGNWATYFEYTIAPLFVVTQDSSRNSFNRDNDRPHINWTIDRNVLTFEFVNPTSFAFVWDYQVDGEPEGWADAWTGETIGEGELEGQDFGLRYESVVIWGPGTETVTVTALEEVRVRIARGAEQNWYLDWIIFGPE